MHIIGGTIEGLKDVKELTPIYNKVTGVASGILTALVTYTVPVSKEFYVQSVLASGQADGEFALTINGDRKLYGRTSSSTREEKNVFGGQVGIKCVAGDVIVLTVTQWEPTAQDFEGTILGFLVSV